MSLRYGKKISELTSLSSASAETQVLGIDSDTTYKISISTINQAFVNTLTSSVNLPAGLISGSSQLTASYDIRYIISGSITETTWNNIISKPSGIVSASSQITAFGFVSGNYETTGRGILSGSISYNSLNNIPSNIVSGAAQISALGFISASSTIPSGTISGSSQLTASYDIRYVQTASFNALTSSFNSFTASAQSVTTGSNSFNGTQIITGSLIVTTGSFVGSVITANTSSLYLTSGSNLYVQNSALVEITGSLKVSGSITISSGSILLPNRPAFRVVGAGSTNIAAQLTLSGSLTSIDYNEGNYYNNTNGLFTAPIAGLYNIYFNGRIGNVNSQMQVVIYKNTNAVQLMWETSGNTGSVHFGVNSIVKLVANDTLEAKVVIGTIQFDVNDSWGATYIG